MAALQRQHQQVEAPQIVQDHIALLQQPTTFTITTGQQPGLFGGPLYNLYKALTAIKLAAQFKAQAPAYDFVPVFWNATEDHDRKELNHTWLQLPQRVEYDVEFRGAVGRHKITQAIEKLGAPKALLQHFAPGRSFGEAFRSLLYDWLGEYGLVVLDGDDDRLKRAMGPILDVEIERSLYPEIQAQSDKMAEAGYPIQLEPSEDNLFRLGHNSREKLTRAAGPTFVQQNGVQFTQTELKQLFKDASTEISPNAALRTLYQEQVLPNLAYVGGWGEIGYWLQLKAAFAATDTFFPMLVPRASALLLPQATMVNLKALGLGIEDFKRSEGELRNQARAQHSHAEEQVAAVQAQVRALHEALKADATDIWPQAEQHIAANAQRNDRYFAQLARRLSNAELAQLPAFKQLIRDKRSLLADGYSQERTLNPWAFLNGQQQELVAFLYDQLEVGTAEQQWIVLPEQFEHPFAE